MNVREPIQQLSRLQSVRRVYEALSKGPILGPPLRWLARGLLPVESRYWFNISAGLGEGLWLHLDPRFEMDYASGKYEPQIQNILSSHLRPGSVFYDVGAHIGVLSLLAARCVGRTGSVFAFEADPENVQRIEAHARRNMLDQIQTIPCAVWSSAGQLQFERASAQSSRNQGTVTAEGSVSSSNTVEIEAVSLDGFVSGHRPPTLIKVDVEGAEAAVLRGSEKVFAQGKPVLICEVHNERAAEEVSKWLVERGYTLEWLQGAPKFPRHLLASWRE